MVVGIACQMWPCMSVDPGCKGGVRRVRRWDWNCTWSTPEFRAQWWALIAVPERTMNYKELVGEKHFEKLSPYLFGHHFHSSLVHHTPHCGNLVKVSHMSFLSCGETNDPWPCPPLRPWTQWWWLPLVSSCWCWWWWLFDVAWGISPNNLSSSSSSFIFSPTFLSIPTLSNIKQQQTNKTEQQKSKEKPHQPKQNAQIQEKKHTTHIR